MTAAPSILSQVVTYFAWNAFYIGYLPSIWALGRLSLHNKYVAAGVALYIARHVILRPSSGPHQKFPFFAKYFPTFVSLRNHLQLNFAPLPKALMDAEAKPNAQFIFAISPHGGDSAFRILMDGMLDEVFPTIHRKILTLAASVLFCLPIMAEFALWTGCVDASRHVAERILKAGNSMIVLPGGEAEMLMTERGVDAVYIKNRKGFVRLAMRFNVPLVPGYVFGSSDTFYTSRFLYKWRWTIMKKFGVCVHWPFALGLWGGLCPLPVKNTICFGEPMSFKPAKAGEPTEEEIDQAHAAYIVALTKLFDQHKAACGYGDRKLVIN